MIFDKLPEKKKIPLLCIESTNLNLQKNSLFFLPNSLELLVSYLGYFSISFEKNMFYTEIFLFTGMPIFIHFIGNYGSSCRYHSMVGTWLYTTYCPLSLETISGRYNFLKQLLNSNGFFLNWKL